MEGAPARRETVDRLVEGGVIAVLRGLHHDDVVAVARAAVEGGIGAVEVTADTPGAMGMIESIAGDLGESALVGAGTVLDAETVREAAGAGAEFVVSPNVQRDVIEASHRLQLAAVPGALSPTEAVRAHDAGADLVKLFPAAPMGPDYLAALAGPLAHVPFVPTGGIDADNAAAFVDAGAAAVAAGGSIVDEAAIERGDYEVVTERARALVDAVRGAR